ncbi:hypothetical protein [Verrucosispora sp. TAA-831]|uniref:GTPase domain-containing protein n=1 Tax=Verrucosispora sp. TAA-831 TaxID=3422227 RepID=UPI003D6E023C
MSHTTQDRIDGYRRWAERVRAQTQTATGPAELLELHKDLIARTYELENACLAPVTIGVVGEYSAGKSLLLGTLLGRPELLPVSTEATTGNVTAVRLSAGPPGSPVEVTSASVSLLSAAQVSAGAAFILNKICNTVAETNLPVDVSTLRHYHPVRDGWTTFETWCRRYVWPEHPEGTLPESSVLAIRDSAWELLRIRDALDRAGELVHPTNAGASRPLHLGAYAEGLTIGGARRPPSSYPVRPPAIPLPAHTELTATVLREIFPLLGRITLQVSVPADRWPVDRLAGVQEVEFLDFPGLNARGAARDDFLSAALLRDTHTILITVRAERPGTEVATRFLALLAGHGRSKAELADSVLVVGTMFDLLTPPAAPTGAVTVDQLARTDPGFRDLARTGYELTGQRPDRIALASLLHAIDVHRLPYRPDRELAGVLAAHRAVVRQRMAAWRGIGDALTAGDATAPLARAVTAAAEDGGVEALRALVARHVTEHGVRLKLDALRRHTATMHQLVTTLQWHDTSASRQAGDDVVSDLFRLRDELLAAEQVLVGGAAKLRPGTADPAWRQHLDDSLDLLRVSVARTVFAWQGWDETLDATLHTGRVVVPTSAAGEHVVDEDDDEEDRRTHTPQTGGGGAELLTNTAQLRLRFAGLVGDATREAGRQFNRLTALWVDETTKALTSVWNGPGDPFDEPARAAALAALDPDGGANRRTWLRSYTQLQWVVKRIRRRSDALAQPAPLDGPDVPDLFPLLPAQQLPWATAPGQAAVTSQDEGQEQHVVRLLRMRQEVADGVLRVAQQRLFDALVDLADRVRREVTEVHQEIPKAVSIERLVADESAAWLGGNTQPGGTTTGSVWQRLLRDWPTDLDPSEEGNK